MVFIVQFNAILD